MTVVIRRLLVVGGAGEGPAKAHLISPVFARPDCSPLWSAVARRRGAGPVPTLCARGSVSARPPPAERRGPAAGGGV